MVCCCSSENRQIPPSTVNMEVWVPAGFNMEDWLSSDQVVSGGPLGTFGRSETTFFSIEISSLYIKKNLYHYLFTIFTILHAPSFAMLS